MGCTPERPRITEIQDSLIRCYVLRKGAFEEGEKAQVMEIEFEIRELRSELEKPKELSDTWLAWQ